MVQEESLTSSVVKDVYENPLYTTESTDTEPARLQALHDYEILDTEAEAKFDDFTLLASQICGTPISLISLVDSDRQWFKSRHGCDLTETPRSQAFCAHALHQTDLLVVPDAAADARFSANPLVTGEQSVRFYAGAPLVSESGHMLGTLACWTRCLELSVLSSRTLCRRFRGRSSRSLSCGVSLPSGSARRRRGLSAKR